MKCYVKKIELNYKLQGEGVHNSDEDVNTYLLTYSMEQSPSWEANWFYS